MNILVYVIIGFLILFLIVMSIGIVVIIKSDIVTDTLDFSNSITTLILLVYCVGADYLMNKIRHNKEVTIYNFDLDPSIELDENTIVMLDEIDAESWRK